MRVPSLDREYSLKEVKATHSRILAWEILCTEEPGWLWSLGLQMCQTGLSTHYILKSPAVSKLLAFISLRSDYKIMINIFMSGLQFSVESKYCPKKEITGGQNSRKAIWQELLKTKLLCKVIIFEDLCPVIINKCAPSKGSLFNWKVLGKFISVCSFPFSHSKYWKSVWIAKNEP